MAHKFKNIEIDGMDYHSTLLGECDKCHTKDFIFFNEDGEGLCEDCLVNWHNKDNEYFDTEDLDLY